MHCAVCKLSYKTGVLGKFMKCLMLVPGGRFRSCVSLPVMKQWLISTLGSQSVSIKHDDFS
jgi:hypothetical protein